MVYTFVADRILYAFTDCILSLSKNQELSGTTHVTSLSPNKDAIPEFKRFLDLYLELRNLFWECSLPAPRIFMLHYIFDKNSQTHQFFVGNCIIEDATEFKQFMNQSLSLLLACHKAHEVFCKCYTSYQVGKASSIISTSVPNPFIAL